MKNRQSHILITGAGGAIGQHCVAEGRHRGLRVSGVGHGIWEDARGTPSIDCWVNADVNISSLLHVADRAGTPDLIIHLAGGSHVGRSFANPAEDFQRTVGSAAQLLEWVRISAPQAKALFVSSAAVYGNMHDGPIPEDAPLAPASPYGSHKLMMEQLVRSYSRNFAVQAGVARPFSTYGPGLRKQMIWELSQRLHASDTPQQLGGTGSETRDFVFIEDVARMILDVVTRVSEEMLVVNICSGKALTIAELAGRLSAAWGRPAPIFSGKWRAGDPNHLVGDAQRATAVGLEPTTSLEDGLTATVAWIGRELEASAQGSQLSSNRLSEGA